MKIILIEYCIDCCFCKEQPSKKIDWDYFCTHPQREGLIKSVGDQEEAFYPPNDCPLKDYQLNSESQQELESFVLRGEKIKHAMTRKNHS
jgi:hypothetical protein